jgi:hypothetical protein
VLGAVSRLAAFPLLALSSQFAATPSASLLAEADRTLASVNFGYTLLLLVFCPGAILFYWLLFKSRLVPCQGSLQFGCCGIAKTASTRLSQSVR